MYSTCDSEREIEVVCTEEICADPCTLPSETGSCNDFTTAYYYDSESDACQSFRFGGCEGNSNRFETIIDCLKQCKPKGKQVLFMKY